MSKLKVSLLALYDYNPDLFSEMELPEGADGDQIVSNLILETMDRDVLYTDPEFMQHAIGIWSKKKMEEWQLLYDALNIEYAPLDNYDRYEDMTETRNLADDHTETRNLANGGTVTGSTSAYDSNTFQNKDQTVASGSDTGTVRHAGTDTGTVRRAGRIHGNIGVTTSTQMLRDYVDYRGSVCFDDIVINDFINQFIRLVY